MSETESLRERCFNKINAMTDHEPDRASDCDIFCGVSAAVGVIFSLCIMSFLILDNFSNPLVQILGISYVVCAIIFVCLIGKWNMPVPLKFSLALFETISLGFYLFYFIASEKGSLGNAFILSCAESLVVVNMISCFIKRVSPEDNCVMASADIALACRKKNQPFTIDQVKIPAPWTQDLISAVIQICVAVMIFCRFTILFGKELSVENFSYDDIEKNALWIGVPLVLSIVTVVIRGLKSFRWRDIFIGKLSTFLFIGALFLLPVVNKYFPHKHDPSLDSDRKAVVFRLQDNVAATGTNTIENDKHISRIVVPKCGKKVTLCFSYANKPFDYPYESIKAVCGGKNVKIEEFVVSCDRYHCFGYKLFITFLPGDTADPLEIEIVWHWWSGESYKLENIDEKD